MFEKMNEIKVFRDPIHSYVKVEYKIIWDCINAREFQRLRRIRQLVELLLCIILQNTVASPIR